MAILEDVSSRLNYDPETGKLFWKVSVKSHAGKASAGSEAGTFHKDSGYVFVGVKCKRYRAHHVAWLLMTGELPPAGVEVDHINGIRSDNRWANLRILTHVHNQQNRRKANKNSRSGILGVSWDGNCNKWFARIRTNNREYVLGRFTNLADAIAARRAAERERERAMAG